MRADNDRVELEADGFQESTEDVQEESLSWLLDMDREEPEEQLFALEDDGYQDGGLTEYEAELAARPLTSAGKDSADDLSLFVDEEIVVSSDHQGGNIYDAPHQEGSASGQSSSGGIKAIDHSQKAESAARSTAADVADGSDILGLADDDDMGETFLAIKRVKGSKPRAKTPETVTATDSGAAKPAAPVEEATTLPTPEEIAMPTLGASAVPAAIAAQETAISAEGRDEDGQGWLSQEALKMDVIDATLDDLPGLLEERVGCSEDIDADELEVAGVGVDLGAEAAQETQSNDWLGDVDLELVDHDAPGEDELEGIAADELEVAGVGADLGAEAAQETESNDWLGDVDLELVDHDAPDEDEPEVIAEAEDQDLDWLEEVQLALVDYDSETAEPDAEPLIQIETATSFDEDIAAAVEQESLDLTQVETDALLDFATSEQLPAEVSAQESGEWLGSSDLELYEMVDDDMTDTELPGDDARLSSEAVTPEDVQDEDCSDGVVLSEAPSTGVIAEPGEFTVANEEPEQLDEVAADDDAIPAGDNVLEYVAQHKPPVNDEEFDEYLLRGAHLDANIADPDELEVERTEGIVSVDPGTEVDIDYHDDFRALEGLGGDSLSAITAVISDVMEEVSALARARMEALGLAADAIEVDVMLGSDARTIDQCHAEGYEQVGMICDERPLALAGLDQAEVDAIYVRLFNVQTHENHNDLLRTEKAQAVVEDEPELCVPEQPIAEQPDGFGDDLFGTDILDDLGEGAGQDAGADIDALIDGLAGDGGEFAADEEPELPAQLDAGEPGEEQVADQLQDVASAEGGFDEDILNAELGGDFAELAEGDSADIDTVFAGLGMGQIDTDEICGVDVDEFAQAEDVEVLAAAVDYAEAGSAGKAANDGDMSWCVPEGITFNYTSQGGNEIFADFLDAFIEEGAATVEKLEDVAGEWERDVTCEQSFAEVGRILHTLKGIAKGVGLQRYGTLIHNFETLLEGMEKPEAGAGGEYFRIVNAWLDASVRGLEFVRENRVDIASEFPAAIDDEPEVVAVAEVEPESPVEEVAASVDDAMSRQTVSDRTAARQKKRDQQLADEGAKALAAQQSVRITSEKLDHLLNLTNQAQQLGVRSTQSTNRNKRASAELQGRLSSVRTHIARIADRALLNVNARGDQAPTSELDALEMDQYSELQEAANILREAVEDLSDLVDVSSRHNAVLDALLKQQATVISTIGSSIQAARVVPVSRLMPGLRRIVRTVSADLEKSVAFKVINETGALDRDHYARCQVILEHMVRNALDHGIESPEQRLAAGKATTGRIAIDVRKSGADYYITLTDDGRGIDPYEVRESAFRKGLDIDIDALSDEEVIQLIFHKGFSTASTLSEISGRGVGMEIVLSELQQIGGDIKVQSTVGLGTTFEVHVPANVTVNGALFVTAGDNSYAIPLTGLVAVEQVPVAEFFQAVEKKELLKLSDMDCEPAYLATLCHGQSLPDIDAWGDSVPVIIAGSQKGYMAIAIDNVEEALELVIRSLGPQFANVPGVAGGATTADGEAIVALDLNMLVDRVATGDISAVAVDHSRDNTLLALVVDDSRTQRMVATSQFDTVGVETITAENGLVAIDLLNTTHRLPDVVLLDVEMPVKDGIETLREIRKSARYKHLPVIMVTSRTGAKHRALAVEAGCDGYMGKPFNFPGLIEQINELTGHDLQVS